MRKLTVLFIFVLLLSGCAKTQALFTLKRVSAEQKAIGIDVEEKDEMFDSLLRIVKSELLKDYTDDKGILRDFGEPIFKKDVEHNGSKVKQWLYRYQTRYFDSDKVYLYFDYEGRLVDHRYVPGGK